MLKVILWDVATDSRPVAVKYDERVGVLTVGGYAREGEVLRAVVQEFIGREGVVPEPIYVQRNKIQYRCRGVTAEMWDGGILHFRDAGVTVQVVQSHGRLMS